MVASVSSTQDGAVIELTGQMPSVVYGPLDASDSLTLIRNVSEDKLVCSGEFEAADVRIAGTSTTVADLIGEVAALRQDMTTVKQFLGMVPQPPPPPSQPPVPCGCGYCSGSDVCFKPGGLAPNGSPWGIGCGCPSCYSCGYSIGSSIGSSTCSHFVCAPPWSQCDAVSREPISCQCAAGENVVGGVCQ